MEEGYLNLLSIERLIKKLYLTRFQSKELCYRFSFSREMNTRRYNYIVISVVVSAAPASMT